MPARQRGLADFTQYFKEQGLLALEVPVQDRLGNTGRPGDFFRGGVLVAERHEQVFGLGEQLPFAFSLSHAGHILGWFNPATWLRGTHRLPHRFSLHGPVSSDYSSGSSAAIPEQF